MAYARRGDRAGASQTRRRQLVVCSILGTTLALGAPAAFAAQPQPGARPAFVVDGRPTPTREVVADLVTLARNHQLELVTVNDEGDRVPVEGVVASWITKLIHAEVAAAELERRGVTVTRVHRLLARRFERHAYGPAVWTAFPRPFQNRQIERTASVIALAQSEGLDLTKRLQTRRAVVALVTDLAHQASVVVAPRFGTWNSDLAVVVPRSQGPAA